MARELQDAYLKSQRTEQVKTTQAPVEVPAIEERIERLRGRLRNGDPDLTPDELEAALSKAEEKRHAHQYPTDGQRGSGRRVLTVLPQAAQTYRDQIKQGLAGNERAALRARVFLQRYLAVKSR
jgi:hypothetical protein